VRKKGCQGPDHEGEHIFKPLTCPEGTDDDQDDDSGDETQGVESRGQGQYSQTDLGLHHQDSSSHPSDLRGMEKRLVSLSGDLRL